MADITQLAAEYARILNTAAAAYRKVAKQLGIKGKGRVQCACKTFSDFEAGSDYSLKEATKRLMDPLRQSFWVDLPDPRYLVYGIYGFGAELRQPNPEFDAFYTPCKAIHDAAQAEWHKLYTQATGEPVEVLRTRKPPSWSDSHYE